MKPHRYNDPGHFHFLTFSCYHKHQFLTDQYTCESLSAAIAKARQKHRFLLHAYVFMPEHVHLLICPTFGEYSISGVLRDIKLPVSQRLIRRWRRDSPKKLEKVRAHQGRRVIHRIWQAGGGYDRNLRDLGAVAKAVEYIEWNPVRRGLVATPTDWFWSSALARDGQENVPLRIDPVEIAGLREP